jgi:arabinogalactan oligomer/maltooligosaccharide transport system substrate-binding protein
MVLALGLLAGCGGQAPAPTVEPAAQATEAPEEPAAPATEAPAAAEPTMAPEPTAAPAAEEPVPAAGAWTCPEGDHTVSIWHGWTGDYFTNIEAIFTAYQAACPNIKIELLQKPDMNNAVVAAVPAGEGPDIIAWVNDQIGRNAETHIIVPLDPFIDTAKFEEEFIPTAVTAMQYGGQTYCYPESMEAITMIYNKDLVKEEDLPKTTDELLAKAKEFNAANPGSYYFVYNAKNDAYFSAPWWQAAGVTIVDEEGTTTFASDAGYAAGEFINSLREVMPEEIDYGIADTLFKEGKAAIIVNGPWYIADLDAAGLNYGLAPLPTFGGTPGTPFVGVKCLMLTTNAEKRGLSEAAVNVMEYYTSKDSQVKLAEANKMVPTNAEAVADPMVTAMGVIKAFGDQAALGNPMPSTPFMGAMWDPMAKGVECIWTGASDVKTCVDNIQTLAEENIAGMQ